MQLTEHIYQTLFQAILEGEFKPGGQFLTEQEAMQRFSASRITVRRAYAKLEENHIILRRQKTGTTVNTVLGASEGKIRAIGILVPIDDAFARYFLETLCTESAHQDALTVLEPAKTGTAQNEAAVRLALHGVHDLVVWGIDRSLDFDLFLRLRVLGINLVFFDRIAPGKLADYVLTDNAAAMKAIFDRISAQDIRKIWFADPFQQDVDTTIERRECCLAECRKRGIEFLKKCPKSGDGAIVAVNDPAALLYTNRGNPIFSIDGSPEAKQAGIVSYRQPMVEMARCCFSSLNNQRRLGQKWKAGEFRMRSEKPFL